MQICNVTTGSVIARYITEADLALVSQHCIRYYATYTYTVSQSVYVMTQIHKINTTRCSLISFSSL